MSITTVKGEMACLKFDLKCLEKNFISSKPIYECNYDRIIDMNGTLKRVQIKYTNTLSPNCDGAVSVNIGKAGPIKGKQIPYQKGDIDVLAVYVERLNQFCWFDKDEWVGKRQLQLRFDPCKNGQTKGCRMAKDYFW